MKTSGKSEQQLKSLWLADRQPLKTLGQAKKFMESVGICLRYWETPGLPIASFYRAATAKDKREVGLKRGIDLSNQLLGSFEVIEVSVVAGRLCLVHKSLMPALFKLAVRRSSPKLSLNSRRVIKLLEEKGVMSAGDVRKMLGASSGQREDPAYAALKELQDHIIVDRGPFKRPKSGIAYLPKEGYPYHFFREAHFELVSESEKLTLEAAAEIFLLRYLTGALFCPIKKMAALFKMFLSPHEIASAIERMRTKDQVTLEKHVAGIV